MKQNLWFVRASSNGVRFFIRTEHRAVTKFIRKFGIENWLKSSSKTITQTILLKVLRTHLYKKCSSILCLRRCIYPIRISFFTRLLLLFVSSILIRLTFYSVFACLLLFLWPGDRRCRTRWSPLLSHVALFAFRPNPIISIPFPFRQLSLISPRSPSCPSQILSPLYVHLSPWFLMHICMHLRTQVLEINGCLSSFSPRHLLFLLLFYFFILFSLELTSLHPLSRSSASVVTETRVRTDLYLSSMISAARIISP